MTVLDKSLSVRAKFPATDASPPTVAIGHVFGSRDDSDRSVPIAIPSGQEYFWSHAWQAGERAADNDLESGDVVEFDVEDVDGIDKWLSSGD